MPSPRGSQRENDPVTVADQRDWNLALGFQEVFTAIVRIRTNHHVVTDAEMFRAQIKRALRAAEQTARTRGCRAEDINAAIFAVVALLDESALVSRNPAFGDWPRLPLQAELYGHQLAGEIFFQELEKTLNRPDSTQTADLLEVYDLCLLLGFKGRFAASGDLRSVTSAVQDKIRRLRGPFGPLSPHGVIPGGVVLSAKSDPWVRALTLMAASVVILAVSLYLVFKFVLATQASGLSS
jgi:type VI secretion system protein ImpK